MSSASPDTPRLAFIGGTGPEGRGLALRFAHAGLPIIIGSRSRERGEEAAAELSQLLGSADITGMSNVDAARHGDIAFLTIPYAGVADTLPPLCDALAGKIVVSAIAPVEFRDGRPVALHPPAGSAAQEVEHLLPASRVVSAFQIVDAHQLQDLALPLDTDIIVCSDDQEARRAVVALARRLNGIRPLSGGRLAASHFVETCTALLITLNRIYKAHSGLRITGIDR